MMAYFNTCPDCGSHLDPGEKCDCQDEKEHTKEIEQKETLKCDNT